MLNYWGEHMHRNDVFIRETFLVDWLSKMKTMQVVLLFKAAEMLYDDIFAIICHIRHCMSCNVSIAHATMQRFYGSVNKQRQMQETVVCSS